MGEITVDNPSGNALNTRYLCGTDPIQYAGSSVTDFGGEDKSESNDIRVTLVCERNWTYSREQ